MPSVVSLDIERLEPRWVLSAGALDTTFDPVDFDGVLVGSFGVGTDENLNAIAVQNDGKIIAVGTVATAGGSNEDFVVARFLNDGSLDPSFGTGGFTTFDFNGIQSVAYDVTIDASGRILVVGSGAHAPVSPIAGWAVARLDASGVLDSTFDGDGKLVTTFTGPTGIVGGEAHGVAVQADGKIVVVGDVRISNIFTDFDFGVVRYNDDGSLDSSFGTGGQVITDYFGERDAANDVVIQSDGKIVVVGTADTATESNNFALARYDTNGILDATFGTGGLVDTEVVPAADNSQDVINSVALESDGQIVVAGHSVVKPFVGSTFTQTDFVIARYNTNGTLDTSFNPVSAFPTDSTPGTLRVHFQFLDFAQAVAIQPDGNYVAGGFVASTLTGTNNSFGLTRVDDAGAFDTSFDGDGHVETLIDSFVTPGIDFARLTDMALQPDGKIVAVGYARATGGNEEFVIARYESGVVASSIAGAADVDEGDMYTLNLAASDPTITQWEINWGDAIQVVPGNPSSVTHVYADGDANYVISASITNASGTTPVGNTVAVAVHNVAPTLAISGDPNVGEGSLYTLTLSSSDPGDDTITEWSIDWGDTVQLVAGNPASVTHTYADGDANYVISATATDEDGTFAAGNTVAVMVDNVAPTADAGGPYTTFINTPVTLHGSGSDVPADVPDLLFEWDFDGNLMTIEAVGEDVEFDPVALGIVGAASVTVTLRVSDGDGGVTTDTAVVSILEEAALLIDGVLYVAGNSTAGDSVIITGSGGSIAVNATFNSGSPDVFSSGDVDEIVIIMGDGNNVVVVAQNVTQPHTIIGGAGNDLISGGGGPSTLLGGAGNDFLFGNGGDDTLLGGTGNDQLFGGTGNDAIVGGEGIDLVFGGSGNDLIIGSEDTDLLVGGGGEDILIGGWTTHDDDIAALDAVMAIWTSADSFDSRVATLTGVGGLLEANEAVFDDEAMDIILGGGGRDLVFGDNDPTDGISDLIGLQSIQDVLVAVT